jgi:hypothetical protein
MGRHSPALSRSSLGLRVVLAALVVLLAWRAIGALLSSRSSRLTRKNDAFSDSAPFKPRESLSEQGNDAAAVEYTDDKRLRAKRDMTPLSQRLRNKRALEQSPSSSPPSIAITAALPATANSLSKSFVSTSDELFNSLSSTAEMLVADALTPALARRLNGLPGTAISSRAEASALQAYLDCVSSTGEWVYEPEGITLAKTETSLTVHKQEVRYAACDKRFYQGDAQGDGTGSEWEVRESLKWSWRASPTCEATAPPSLEPSADERARNALLPSRYRLCELLEGKHLLLVGDTTQWSLHDLLLDWTTLKPQTCYGDRYCMAHALCSDILTRGRKGSQEARKQARQQVENGEADRKVYHRLPLPPAISTTGAEKRQLGNVASPPDSDADGAVASSEGSESDRSSSAEPLHEKRDPARLVRTTLLRYRRADGLRFARNHVAPDYRPDSTGVRELNQQWLADSRRSDLVILTKAPLPLPREGHNATFDAWVREYVVARDQGVSAEAKALRVLEAAKWATEQVWLPELVETLRALRAPPSPPDQLVVYRGGWRQHVDCAASTLRDRVVVDFSASAASLTSSSSPGDGPPPRVSQPTWASLLMQPSGENGEMELVPLHIAYHNAQLVLQNHLARTVILPAFGIPYLDLETPLSVWRSGMVGSSAASPFHASSPHPQQHQQQAVLSSAGLRSPTSGDCTRYCFPSPGLAVERFFLGAMATVFEAGWAGDAQRRARWTGEGFESVQDRHHAARERG